MRSFTPAKRKTAKLVFSIVIGFISSIILLISAPQSWIASLILFSISMILLFIFLARFSITIDDTYLIKKSYITTKKIALSELEVDYHRLGNQIDLLIFRGRDKKTAVFRRDLAEFDEFIDYIKGTYGKNPTTLRASRTFIKTECSQVYYTCAIPPSTGSSAPVMNEASEEARNKTALATSSEFPKRFNGTCCAKPAPISCTSCSDRPTFP